MASVRSSLSRSARASVRATCATSIVCVSRVRYESPSWLTKTCVLYSRRRNAAAWMTRSRSRMYAVRNGCSGSSCCRPRLAATFMANGASSRASRSSIAARDSDGIGDPGPGTARPAAVEGVGAGAEDEGRRAGLRGTGAS